jgi:HAD superfamily hydrolase (TIGR01509 family)
MSRPHLIFDFGGVLFRWRPALLLAQVLPDLADTPERAEHWKAEFFQGYGGDWGAFDSGLIDASEMVRRIALRTGLTPAQVQAVVDAVPGELQPQAGMVALLERARAAGHRLFFLSNMPAPYATHLEQAYPLTAWFEDGVFSSRVGTGKPGPEIFKLALARFGIEPGHSLFIDDHPANIEAAEALGLPALLFRSADQLAEAFEGLGIARPPV